MLQKNQLLLIISGAKKYLIQITAEQGTPGTVSSQPVNFFHHAVCYENYKYFLYRYFHLDFRNDIADSLPKYTTSMET